MSPDLDALPVPELLRLARNHQEAAMNLILRAEQLSAGTTDQDAPQRNRVGHRREWRLTERERHVAELLVEGLTNRRIARQLDIAERTVKNHLHSIFHKLGVQDRTQAAIKLLGDGIEDDDPAPRLRAAKVTCLRSRQGPQLSTEIR